MSHLQKMGLEPNNNSTNSKKIALFSIVYNDLLLNNTIDKLLNPTHI
jgi:hypothetical protein